MSHNYPQSLNFKNQDYLEILNDHTFKDVLRDLSPDGDITSDCVFDENKKVVEAKIIAKESGILAGIAELIWFLGKCKKFNIKILFFKKDGEKLKKGDVVLKFQAKVKSILMIERVILNLLQRMSGIATETFDLVQELPKNSKIKVCATRKVPFTLLDKKAVSIGGGFTHRLNLSDAILIKDSHIDVFGRDQILKVVEKALENMKKLAIDKDRGGKTKAKFFEVEVLNIEEALKIAKFFKKAHLKIPSVIMLDNFEIVEIEKTLDLLEKENLRKNLLIEVSGGINAKNIQKYAKLNIDFISVGYITNSPKALDLSLKIN
jgi:nicotinate-nucleotide pyrophosphorylase (carboxylating)